MSKDEILKEIERANWYKERAIMNGLDTEKWDEEIEWLKAQTKGDGINVSMHGM